MSLLESVGSWFGLSKPDAPSRSQGSTARAPRVGDIVNVHYPSSENPNRPGPKARPAVVLWVQSQPDGTLALEVSPGAPESGKPLSAGQSVVDTKPGLAAAGLRSATRFDMTRRAVVPWNLSYISAKGGAPILGRLTDRDFDKARLAYRVARDRDARSNVFAAAQRQADSSFERSQSLSPRRQVEAVR